MNMSVRKIVLFCFLIFTMYMFFTTTFVISEQPINAAQETKKQLEQLGHRIGTLKKEMIDAESRGNNKDYQIAKEKHDKAVEEFGKLYKSLLMLDPQFEKLIEKQEAILANIEKHKRNARKHLEDENLFKAIDEYQNALRDIKELEGIKEISGNWNALRYEFYNAIAEIYENRLQKFELALEYYKKAVTAFEAAFGSELKSSASRKVDMISQNSINDYEPMKLFLAIEKVWEQKQYVKTLEDCKALLQKYPNSSLVPYVLFLKGAASLELREYANAVQAFNRIIAKYPKYKGVEDAYFFLGESYRKAGQIDDAINVYQTYLEMYPAGRHVKSIDSELVFLSPKTQP